MKTFVIAALVGATTAATTPGGVGAVEWTDKTTPPVLDGHTKTAEKMSAHTDDQEHGNIASSVTGALGTTACPIECKFDNVHKVIHTQHSTNHGTGLDDTSVHSQVNFIPHTCKHNQENDECECTCIPMWAGTCANGSLIEDTSKVHLGRTAHDQCGACDDGYYLTGTSCTAYEGSCTNGALIAVQASRTDDNQCGSCDAGYYLDGTSCVAFEGSCNNGALIALTSRTDDNQCGSCDAGYDLSGTSCVAFEGSCTNGALIALTSRTQANHCGTCDNGYFLDGTSCTAFEGTCNNGDLITQTDRRQHHHCGSCDSNYYLNGKSCSYCSHVSCGSNYNRGGSCSGTNNGFTCSAQACDSNYCNGRGNVNGNKVTGCSCSCTGGWFGSRCTNKNGNWGGFSPKPGHSCKKGGTTCGCDSRPRYFKKEGDPRTWNQAWDVSYLTTGGNNGLGWGTACNGGGTIVMKRNCMNKYGSGTCANDGYGGAEHNAPCARAYHLSDLQGSFYKTSCYRCQSCFDVED